MMELNFRRNYETIFVVRECYCSVEEKMRDGEWDIFLLVGERQKGLLTLKWFKLPKMQWTHRRSSHLWQVDNISWLRHVVGNVLCRLNSSQLDQTLSRLIQDLVSKSCFYYSLCLVWFDYQLGVFTELGYTKWISPVKEDGIHFTLAKALASNSAASVSPSAWHEKVNANVREHETRGRAPE